MIVTTLEHLGKQIAMNARFERAIEFLRREGWRGQPDGKIEIDGEQVYALAQSYETKRVTDQVDFEGHYQYIDIQQVIEGQEIIYWTNAAPMIRTIPYDPAKDIWFSTAPVNDATRIVLSRNCLAVFFPEDAHATRLAVDQPSPIKKVIIKVAVA
ncbi:MAG: DUF386 domain-containing protein [Chloroflexi bacterium]|nr:DUF386 domain-containing protein [Chloroflexota bacterium]